VNRGAKICLPIVVLGQLAFFTWVGRHRFIDGDEGAFLLASRLILAHKKPYIDFFYQQAPLLPYVYGPWLKFSGISWNSGRTLSALLSVLLGTILFEHVWRETGSWRASLCSVLLFATSTLEFAWFSVVKTHCLAAFFLFSAYAVLTRTSSALRPWMLAFSGVLLALSVDTRSYILLILPVFLFWILQNSNRAERPRTTGYFAAGFLVGVLPAFWLFVSAPDAFLFNNLRYHALRFGDAGLIGWWPQKIAIAIILFLGGSEATGVQWSMLFCASVGFLAWVPKKSSARFAVWIAAVLGVICLLPTPSYLQYFSLCVPFLIVGAVLGVNILFARMTVPEERRLQLRAVVFSLAIYLGFGCYDLRKYTVTGDGVPGVHAALDRGDWRIKRVVQVSETVDQIARPGEVVASFWSGDIFQSHAEPLQGLESPFAITVADKLTPQQRAKYHIITWNEVEADFTMHRPRVFVLRNQISSAFPKTELAHAQELAQHLAALLQAHGYTLVRSVGGISIYVFHES